MVQIIKCLAKIPHDKLLHSFFGTMIYAITAIVDIDISIAFVIAIAVGKEIYDEYKYRGFDFIDLLYTIAIPILLYIGSYTRGAY